MSRESEMNAYRAARWLSVVGALLAVPAGAVLDVAVSPPRFEINAKPGDVVREAITITNGAGSSARFEVKTADWEIDAKGGVLFNTGNPGPDSCRSWVRLERHEVNVAAKDSRAYRFEVHTPADAGIRECRFALMLSSEAMTVQPPGPNQIQIPVHGGIGVIVYVALGGAKPELQFVKIESSKVGGKVQPVATVRNRGRAHGRVFGSLEVLDANRQKLELVADETAILAGTTRTITLNPVDWSKGEARGFTGELSLPMHVRGRLQFTGGGEVKIDQILR